MARTVAGFLNVEGGVLLIGVADDRTVLGLDPDIATLGRRDIDGFEQHLVQILSAYLGGEFIPNARASFQEKDGRTVCMLRVEPSPKPVFLSEKGAKEFFIRTGNTTRPLDTEATHNYIGMHWEQ